MKNLKALTLMILAILILPGCLDSNDVGGDTPNSEEGPCESYPDRQYLSEMWGQYANYSGENYDVVRVGVGRWGQLETGERPGLYVDWDKYPMDSRHQLFVDVLCSGLWRIKTIPTLSEHFTSMVITSDEIAVEALDALQKEHLRQTGELQWEGTCCYIIFEGYVFGSGCHGAHKTHDDGSSSTSYCSWEPAG